MKRTRVDHDDEPEWTVLDWKILYAQMTALRAFWDARLKLSYKERETLPAAPVVELPPSPPLP